MFNSPVAIKLTPHFVGSCQNSSLRPTEALGAENPPALVLESIFLPLHSIHCPELLHSLQLRLSGIYTQDPCNGETTILVYCLLTITTQICLLLPWDCIKNSEWGLCNILVQNMPASTCIFCCKSRLQSKAAAQQALKKHKTSQVPESGGEANPSELSLTVNSTRNCHLGRNKTDFVFVLEGK